MKRCGDSFSPSLRRSAGPDQLSTTTNYNAQQERTYIINLAIFVWKGYSHEFCGVLALAVELQGVQIEAFACR